MTARVKKNTNDRLTVEALRFYVPFFHIGNEAHSKLQESDYSEDDYYQLVSEASLRDMVVLKIASLSGPLITRELNKIIAGSHLRFRDEDVFDILYYAGIDGIYKGLAHFDVEKLKNSSTNYLFQWFTTYAKKELSTLEAPFGIAPSRFAKYKKISAVRKKISSEKGSYATNEDVYDYMQSGKADIATLNGRLEKTGEPYKSNKAITLELIQEQEEYEKKLSTVDVVEDASRQLSTKTINSPAVAFEDTLFGDYVTSREFSLFAVAVLKSEMGYGLNDKEFFEFERRKKDYQKVKNRWVLYFKDKDEGFYSYLKEKGYENMVEKIDKSNVQAKSKVDYSLLRKVV